MFVVDCYEIEVLQINKLTKDIIENKDYVSNLTSSLNDVENKYSKVLDEYEDYKISNENTMAVLKNKLNASEDIVKQLLPSNSIKTTYINNYPLNTDLILYCMINILCKCYINPFNQCVPRISK